MDTPTQLVLFRQFAREFSNLSDSIVEAWFSTALIFLDSQINSVPTEKQNMAVALYSAHLCWLDKYPGQGGASRGPILSESDDRIGAKKQYQLIQNSDTWLGQSFYGQAFSELTGIFSKSKSKSAILTRFGTNPSFL